MFKYYFTFKKSELKTRWLYNDETDIWKKTENSAYTDRFFKSYSLYLAGLFFCVAFLAVTIYYLPFKGLFDGLKAGSLASISLWLVYVLLMLIFALFVKRARTASILYFATTIILLVVSDVMILEYDTPFYSYIIYGLLISALFSLIIVLISRLFFERAHPKYRPTGRSRYDDF